MIYEMFGKRRRGSMCSERLTHIISTPPPAPLNLQREWTLYFLGMAIPVLVPMTVWLVLRQTAAQKKKKA